MGCIQGCDKEGWPELCFLCFDLCKHTSEQYGKGQKEKEGKKKTRSRRNRKERRKETTNNNHIAKSVSTRRKEKAEAQNHANDLPQFP